MRKAPDRLTAREWTLLLIGGLLFMALAGGIGAFYGTQRRADEATQARQQASVQATAQAAHEAHLAQFASELEALRQQYHIPGMSVAVVKGQDIIFARGFGLADVENGIPATEHTPYRIASLTKPMAAVLLLQLVDEGQLALDAPLAAYYPGYASECQRLGRAFATPYLCDQYDITIRHHLTHTAQGTPGEAFVYNGDLYALLSGAVEQAAGQSFEQALAERITGPLEMTSTATSQHSASPEILDHLARPYRTDAAGNAVLSNYPGEYTSAAAGVISTVLDLARFSIALDQDVLLSAETRAAMFTPATTASGEVLPYGLGWFVQEVEGTRLVWHYGWWPGATSALLLKVPEQELTFILLADGDGASAPFDLAQSGDVLRSPFAALFLDMFAQPEAGDPGQRKAGYVDVQ